MPLSLRNFNSTPRSDTFNAVSTNQLGPVTVGAAVVNTTVQYGLTFIIPFQFKIRKVAFNFSAIDSVAGTDLFNLVVGTTGAYTQGNAAPNDNSYDQVLTGGVGYPTNVATTGMSVFAADQAFTVANFPSVATTGGYGVAIPTNVDAVYPAGTPLTTRLTTTAGTGAITNLTICLGIVPMRLRISLYPTESVPTYGVDA